MRRIRGTFTQHAWKSQLFKTCHKVATKSRSFQNLHFGKGENQFLVSHPPSPRIRPQNAEKLPAPAYDNYYGENMYAAGPEEGGGGMHEYALC